MILAAAIATACDAGAPPPKPTPPPPVPVVTPVATPIPWDGPEAQQPPLSDDERDVIAAELQRWQADPKFIVDGPLAGKNHYVLVEPGLAKVPLPAPFVSITYREAEQEADQVHAHVGVMWIQDVTVTGQTARITAGGWTVVTAAERGQPRSCCCHQTDEYVRYRGHWKYKDTTDGICA
jgi:hypothetical protein